MIISFFMSALLLSGSPGVEEQNSSNLIRATEYLREINCQPEGHFVLLDGSYSWEDGKNPPVKFHPNDIISFAEKKEVGKTIKYLSSTALADKNPKIKVAACYLYVGDEVLFVKRPEDSKTEPARWGIPGGKFEKGESADEAVVREIVEETGIDLRKDFPNVADRPLEPVYVTLSSGFCFLYCPYEVCLSCKPQVTLSREHVGYRWVTLEEARKRLPLITGEEECIDIKLAEDHQKCPCKA